MTIEIDRRVAHVALAVALVAGLLWLGWKHFSPGREIVGEERLTALDPSNAGINIRVTQPWLTDSVLVFDARKPGERDYDRFDLTRCLLQCAQDLASSNVSRVYLACDGRRVYYINSSDFKKLGVDYERGSTWNNTMLAARIPTVTYTLNDSLAFPSRDGMLQPLDNASDWNTMMSNLMAHESPSLLKRVLRLFF